VRARARFSADRIAPLAKIDADDWFPRELWPEMGALGLHGITVEEADGGLGLGYLEHVVAQEEVSARVGLYRPQLWCALQSVRQPDPPLGECRAKGEISAQADLRRACRQLAMSEAGAGSDVVSMKLKAEKRDGGLSAERHEILDHQRGLCRHAGGLCPTGEGTRGITAFLIEKDMPGFSIGQKIDKMGMRGSPTAELVFDDCFVPDENVMGR
jgi:isovaleryl-CoA dehydrogenase